MKTQRVNVTGFTLIELMVTIAIAAILMMVAAPSFTTFQRNAQLTSFSNTMLASMNTARGEAMKRGMYAMVMPFDGTNVSTDWSSGWVVFVDVNHNQTYDAATDITLLTQGPPPSYLAFSGTGHCYGTNPYLMFDASGYAKPKSGDLPNCTLTVTRNDVTGTDQFAQTRRIKIATTGRVKVCTPTSGTDTNCIDSSAL
jgi:type IV fimbrial biogenesis protein FimT